ncbi:MAG: beta strand repeat-containing protein [Elainellaceae cyanobacterium]
MGLGIRPQPAVAQSLIVPDSTLGAERSQVIENVDGTSNDLIVGGARRAQNLFHSFEAFSVGEGRGAFFDSPGGLENIFSRVTGSSPSEIFGTLGVDGSANLFFLNPNGIVFGENSSLAVEGSFVGSTASEIAFTDGSVFSAVAPTDSLLTVSVPLGLQYGPPPTGSILTNRGAIVAGQDLTLAADVLDLRGELGAGRDLTLRADALQIRDAVDAPFVAASGGAMVLQGDSAVDIFALNHPESGFFAGGDLTLRSAAPVVGDARYWSGGNLSIETLLGDPGALTSPNDPVLRAAGDVTFDSYTGASLHIIAGGSVAIPGAIAITGADPANGLVETVTLSDGSTVAVNGQMQPTLDVRAGTLAVGAPGLTGDGAGFVPGVPVDGAVATSADITLGDITVPTDGLVLVTNQFAPNPVLPGGAIALGAVTAPSSVGGDSVVIDGRTSLNVAGNIFTSSTDGGSGGDIFLAAADSVLLDDSDITSSLGEDAVGNGGDVTITTGTLALLNGSNIFVSTLGVGNAGDVTITATESVAFADDSNIFSVVNAVGIGNSGAITIITPSLSLSGGSDLIATTNGAGNAGSIFIGGNEAITSQTASITGGNNLSASADPGSTGNAGVVSIDTGTLVVDDSIIVAVSNGNGDVGTVDLSARESIALNNSGIRARLDANGAGAPGGIEIDTGSLTVSGGTDVDANTSGEGDAGDITIAADAITFDGSSTVSANVNANAVGEGGSIDIETGSLEMRGGTRLSVITIGQGNAGSVTIDAAESVVLDEDSNILGLSTGGAVGDAGTISISTGTLELRNDSELFTNAIGQGDAGEIVLNASEITLSNNSNLFASADPSANDGNAGSITITAETLTANDADIKAVSNRQGAAGTIAIDAGVITLDNASTIFVQVESGTGGAPGSIDIATDALELRGDSDISANTNSAGNGGSIAIAASESVLLSGAGTSILTNVAAAGAGNGGDIDIETLTLEVLDGAILSARSSGVGDAGNISIRAETLDVLDGGALQTDSAAIATAPGEAGMGNAGDITIIASDRVRFIGGRADGASVSGAFAQVADGVVGDAGDIKIEAADLVVRNGATLRTDAGGQGNAGTIMLTAEESVTFNGESSALSRVNDGAVGTAGDIMIATGALRVRDGSNLDANTSGTGDAGNVFIDASGIVVFDEESNAFSSIEGGTGNAGNIEIRASTLEVLSGSTLQADNGSLALLPEEEGTGDSGSIIIDASDRATFSGRSADGVFASGAYSGVDEGASGNAGSIAIAAGILEVLDDAVLTTQTNGEAGVSDGASAGNITLEATDLTISAGGDVLAGVSEAGVGEAGNIFINAETAEIFQDSLVSTSSFGQGNSGNISIDADERLTIRNSSLLTSAVTNGNFSSGDILINAGEDPLETERVVVLRNGDIITSTNFLGNDGNTGDGGDIFISAASIDAGDDTDIISSSINGRGGDITLFNFTADNGPEFTDVNYEDNDIVNISAEGDPDGAIAPPSLLEPMISEPVGPLPAPPGPPDDHSDNGNDPPSQGEGENPDTDDEPTTDEPIFLSINDALIFDRRQIDTEALVQRSRIDTDELIANSCFVPSEDGTGTFIITGAGGLQSRPGDSRPSAYPTGDVQAIADEIGWQPGDPIVEPEGVYQLPNGELVLSHQCR